MTDSFVPIPGLNPAKNLETSEFTNGAGVVVNREGVFVADPDDFDAKGNVRNTTPGATDYGPVTRPIIDGGTIDEVSNVTSVDTVDALTSITNTVSVTQVDPTDTTTVINTEPATTAYGAVVRPVVTTDFWLNIASGAIAGMTGVNKFGRNPGIASTTTREIWDGGTTAYVFPATALMTSISQTTDQAAMRGATIEVQGLDASWNLVIQDVVLNASDTTTVVTLGTALIRCFRMKVNANVVSTSSIRVHNAGETVDYAIITAGNNQTLMAIYTVPNGKTAYMTSLYASLNSSAQQGPTELSVDLWERDNDAGYAPTIKHATGLDPDANSSMPPHDFKPYRKITQKTDVWINATPTGKTASVSAGFDLILVDN